MREETLDVLLGAPHGLLIDGTLGMGGLASAWLEATAPAGRLIGFDLDASALEQAREKLARFGERVELHHASYKDAGDVLGDRRPDAAVLDLGLGSHQLDDPSRGFSFRFDAPLDMRFDTTRPGRTGSEILAQEPAIELARIFSEYGEERAAKKLARVICDERERAPIRTTFRFAEIVRRVVGTRPGRARIDPATRAFQALRIAVNEELEGLDDAIVALAERLVPGGRIAVLAFHSLEDRIVKRTLRALSEPKRDELDPTVPDEPGMLELVERKARQPSDAEIAVNPRARSARLRWGVKR